MQSQGLGTWPAMVRNWHLKMSLILWEGRHPAAHKKTFFFFCSGSSGSVISPYVEEGWNCPDGIISDGLQGMMGKEPERGIMG